VDYFGIVKRAWRITYQHKFLWIFGLFLGTSASFSFNGINFNQVSYTTDQADLEKYFGQAYGFLLDNLIIIIISALALLFLILFFMVLSVISQGAMIGAVDKLNDRKEINFSKAFRIGLKNFWKILGIYILFGLIAFLSLVILAAPTIALFAYGLPGRGFIMMLLSILIFIPLVILFSFASIYSLRFAVIGKKKVIDSINLGVHLFFNNFWQSILMYLILLGIMFLVSIIAAIAFLVILLFIGIPLVALGFVLFPVAGIASAIILAIIGLIIIFIAAFLISSLVNTYKSSLWTLTYKNLNVE
jgi:hypothetical protein